MKQAEWIAAASLDRYLQATGKGQIYGTQFAIPFGASGATMEPYDQDLLTDGLRVAAGAPTLAEQEARLPEIEARMKSRAASPANP